MDITQISLDENFSWGQNFYDIYTKKTISSSDLRTLFYCYPNKLPSLEQLVKNKSLSLHSEQNKWNRYAQAGSLLTACFHHTIGEENNWGNKGAIDPVFSLFSKIIFLKNTCPSIKKHLFTSLEERLLFCLKIINYRPDPQETSLELLDYSKNESFTFNSEEIPSLDINGDICHQIGAQIIIGSSLLQKCKYKFIENQIERDKILAIASQSLKKLFESYIILNKMSNDLGLEEEIPSTHKLHLRYISLGNFEIPNLNIDCYSTSSSKIVELKKKIAELYEQYEDCFGELIALRNMRQKIIKHLPDDNSEIILRNLFKKFPSNLPVVVEPTKFEEFLTIKDLLHNKSIESQIKIQLIWGKYILESLWNKFSRLKIKKSEGKRVKILNSIANEASKLKHTYQLLEVIESKNNPHLDTPPVDLILSLNDIKKYTSNESTIENGIETYFDYYKEKEKLSSQKIDPCPQYEEKTLTDLKEKVNNLWEDYHQFFDFVNG